MKFLDDYRTAKGTADQRLSDKRFAREVKRQGATTGEWVHTSVVLRKERDILLRCGWEMVDSSLLVGAASAGVGAAVNEFVLRRLVP